MAKHIFSVKGMHCSACVMTLEGLEDELNGIRSLKVSLHKQRAEIDYDETTITEDEIRRAFEREGYGLTRVTRKGAGAVPGVDWF